MKRLTSILLALALIFSMSLAVFAQESGTLPYGLDGTTVHPIIEQVYGGGGKGETPISNSFVELYNPSDTNIDLSGYTLSDGTKTLPLNGTIPANGYYLIIGMSKRNLCILR